MKAIGWRTTENIAAKVRLRSASAPTAKDYKWQKQ